MSIPIAIDIDAHTLGAFRACRHGDAIAYRATLESVGLQAVMAILAPLFDRHYLRIDHGRCGCYGVLDFLDASGSILGDACIPDMAAFDHLRTAIGLRITSSDCDGGCP